MLTTAAPGGDLFTDCDLEFFPETALAQEIQGAPAHHVPLKPWRPLPTVAN